MNVITLNNDQLALVRSTLQKQQDEILGDINMGNLSTPAADLLNGHFDLIRDCLREIDDCNTPKAIPAPTLQQTAGPVWGGTTSVANVLGVDPKKLYNIKQAGKFRPGYHFRKEGRNYSWNVATVSQFLSENSH
jgi:hypothetical protein